MIPIDERVRVVHMVRDEVYITWVCIGAERNDWRRVSIDNDEESAKAAEKSMLQGLRAACEDARKQCAEVANKMRMRDDPMSPEDVMDAMADPEAWCRATAEFMAGKIGDAIRELEL